MTPGELKLKEILEALEEEGKVLNEEQMQQLKDATKEYDRLYAIIITNQETFGVSKVKVEE